MPTLEQQLNMICDSLANDAITRYLACKRAQDEGPQFLPLKKAPVVLDGVKLTTDVGTEVGLQLGMEEAERSYTKPCNLVNRVNRGGLGYGPHNSFTWWPGKHQTLHLSQSLTCSNCGYQSST
jgi:hypothetical protein